MARKNNTSETADVKIRERVSPTTGYISFCLDYSINGKRHRELLKGIPRVKKEDRKFYNDCLKQAQKIAADKQTEIRNRKLNINTNSNLLLKDWMDIVAERYEQNETNVANRSTYSRGVRYVRGLLIEYAGESVKLIDVDKAFVRGYVDFLRMKYPNTGTAEQKYKKFSAAMNLACKDELIASNPCDKLSKCDKIKVEEKEREYLSEDELRMMMDTPCRSEKTRQVFLFMCFCGLRISDVSKLKWKDIYSEDVNGEERLGIHIKVQKTQKSLKFRLSKAAVEYLPERGEKSDDDYVFDLLSEQAMRRALKIWAKASGITKNVTLHTGRHTFATLGISKGIDIYVICSLLGHSDVRVTQVYAKVEQKKMDEVASVYDKFSQEGGQNE